MRSYCLPSLVMTSISLLMPVFESEVLVAVLFEYHEMFSKSYFCMIFALAFVAFSACAFSDLLLTEMRPHAERIMIMPNAAMDEFPVKLPMKW